MSWREWDRGLGPEDEEPVPDAPTAPTKDDAYDYNPEVRCRKP